MEVCGRYHHWMPIMVYVVHKDIFLSWCLAYLRLITARSEATTRALAVLASADLALLESTLAALAGATTMRSDVDQLRASLAVTTDLLD